MLRFRQYLMEKGMLFKVKLTAGELLKPGREGRGDTLIAKLQDNDPFILSNGQQVTIRSNDEQIKAIRRYLDNRDRKSLNDLKFAGTDGGNYKLSDFAKTAEFGGKPSGYSVRGEDEALTAFRKELQKAFDEDTVPYIFIQIGRKIEKVANIESTPGTPKSDFHMEDENGNEVFWLSHKVGRRANDFQQYGGMPELKGENSKDMESFVDAVKEELKTLGATRFPMKTAFARKVKDQNIKLKTLFGKEYKAGEGGTSRQNIDVLYQGPMKLKKLRYKGKIPVYTITSNHTILHGKVGTGDYEPYYYVRPEQAKNQFGIGGARFFIVAKTTALKNRNTKEI